MTTAEQPNAASDVASWLDRLTEAPKETTRDYQRLTSFQDELNAWAQQPAWRHQLGETFRENVLSPISVLRSIRVATGRASGYMTAWARAAAWSTPCSWNMDNIPIPERLRWWDSIANLYRDDMPGDGLLGAGSLHCEAIEAYMRHHVWAWDRVVLRLGGGYRLNDITLLERIATWHDPSPALLRVTLVAMESQHGLGRAQIAPADGVLKCLQRQRSAWVAEVQRAYDAYALLHGYTWNGVDEMAACVKCIGEQLQSAHAPHAWPLPVLDGGANGY